MAHEFTVQVVGPRLLREAVTTSLCQHGLSMVPTHGDIVVLLPSANPEECFKQSGTHDANTRYVLLTDGRDIAAYRPKTGQIHVLVGDMETTSTLVDAIHAAERGDAYCSPQLLSVLIPRAFDTPTTAAHRCTVLAGKPEVREALSAREREVASAAAGGMTNEEVANHLCVSVPTVKFHLFQVFRKLGVTRRAQLAGVLQREKES